MNEKKRLLNKSGIKKLRKVVDKKRGGVSIDPMPSTGNLHTLGSREKVEHVGHLVRSEMHSLVVFRRTTSYQSNIALVKSIL